MEQLPLVGYIPAPSGAATPDRTHTSVMPLSTSAKRTLLTRRILPPPLAQTNRFRRSRSVGGLRLRLVSCNSRCAMTRPIGFVVPGKAAAVEPLLTSSGLGEGPPSLLCPRLTPAPARGPLLAAALAVAGALGEQVSLSKDVNSCCTTGPFISGTEHRVSLCRASLPVPSTLYGLSVRRLISFDRWLPSHGASRLRSCFGLMFGSSCPSL